MKKMIGIILAGGSSKKMKPLTKKRAASAMPIGGSYRCIDFALSSMANSSIKTVAVLTQHNTRSLNDHLSSSKWWDFGRKNGGLYVFSPTLSDDNQEWYRGTADAIYQNRDYLARRHEPYVVISSGDSVYKIDFEKVLAYHIEKGADITIVAKEMGEGVDLTQYGVLTLDENNRVVDMEEKPVVPKSAMASTGIYIIRRRLLLDMLERCHEEDRYDLVQDVLVRYKDIKKIFAYPTDSYWEKVSDPQSYYRLNMDFLKKENRDFFFRQSPEVRSRVEDNPPAKFNTGCTVKNSLIASGCIINGTVENSVLFRKVFVAEGAVIKNCVILNDNYIGEGVHLENAIVESRGTFAPNDEHILEEVGVIEGTAPRYLVQK